MSIFIIFHMLKSNIEFLSFKASPRYECTIPYEYTIVMRYLKYTLKYDPL